MPFTFRLSIGFVIKTWARAGFTCSFKSWEAKPLVAINNFEEDIDKDYNVKKPIFKNTKNIFSKELENEFNLQYSNLCYMKFK